jgi:CRP-like cAMP-binding protein
MVDASILSQWVVNVGRRDARQRIAHLLCEMATRLQTAPTDGCTVFPFAITQTQLADATGLTPVHVNRVLKSLREENLAEVSSGAVRISSFDALADFGDFDAGYLQTDVRPEQRMRLAEGV